MFGTRSVSNFGFLFLFWKSSPHLTSCHWSRICKALLTQYIPPAPCVRIAQEILYFGIEIRCFMDVFSHHLFNTFVVWIKQSFSTFNYQKTKALIFTTSFAFNSHLKHNVFIVTDWHSNTTRIHVEYQLLNT